MKTLPLTTLALALAAGVSAPALAQDGESTSRIEPYVGVMGGLHDFDNDQYKGGPPSGYRGWIVEGVAGVNYNFGPVFVGAEGSLAKGVDKDIDWEYGAAGRFGVKAGKDSIFFAKVGYQWTQFDGSARPPVSTSRKFDGTTYGFGTELSLADLGGSQDSSNIRLRAQVDTRGNFHSFRPMAGIVAKF
ncbi:outer membrane beta-barrel protein [Sphingobium nicotianae]|uniref:Outer membrane beta-barrel protein n=1 Tax=Sphingobium nicotianae TaxID=2782607 RepID=A0A9X1DEF3_9SPHN|nr:outer membrane beta-barrel protein [Sphingobium nicotianae]MBT2188406.1 outer membrane beta-barrel protein [Sphingobium nicotianae]